MLTNQQIENMESENQEEFIDLQEVDEVVDDQENDMPEEDDMDEDMGDEEMNPEDHGLEFDEDGNIVLDMTNNSVSYFDEHKDSIFTIAAHPSLPLAVTGGGDNIAYMWTTHSNPTKLAAKLEGFTESVVASSFTFDGSYLICGDMTGKVLIFKSTKKGQVWKKIYELEDIEEVMWIKVHPKQNVFAVGALNGSVWCYSIDENQDTIDMIFSGFSHSSECTNGVFVNVDSLDELNLVTISEDGSIIGWNCYQGVTYFKIDSNNGLKGLTPPWVSICANDDPSKRSLAVGSRDSKVAIINYETGQVLTMFTALELGEDQDIYDSSIESISWYDKFNLMAIGLVSGDVFIFDANTWRLRKSVKTEDAITKLEFIKSITTKPVLLVSSMDGKIYKFDARTGELLFKYHGHNAGVLGFALDYQEKRLMSAGDEGVSLVFEVESENVTN